MGVESCIKVMTFTGLLPPTYGVGTEVMLLGDHIQPLNLRDHQIKIDFYPGYQRGNTV